MLLFGIGGLVLYLSVWMYGLWVNPFLVLVAFEFLVVLTLSLLVHVSLILDWSISLASVLVLVLVLAVDTILVMALFLRHFLFYRSAYLDFINDQQ